MGGRVSGRSCLCTARLYVLLSARPFPFPTPHTHTRARARARTRTRTHIAEQAEPAVGVLPCVHVATQPLQAVASAKKRLRRFFVEHLNMASPGQCWLQEENSQHTNSELPKTASLRTDRHISERLNNGALRRYQFLYFALLQFKFVHAKCARKEILAV